MCIKASGSDYGPSGNVGGPGVTLGNVSAFIDAPFGSVTVAIVAAGGDCSTPLATESVDLSTAGLHFTAVAYDTTAGVGITIAQQFAPQPGHTNLEIVDAYLSTSSDGGPALGLAFPLQILNEAATLGEAAGADFLPLTNNVLIASTGSAHPYLFPTLSSPAGTRSTAVFVGNGADLANPPVLILCDQSAATPTCSTIPAAPRSFMRIANLSDATEPDHHFWIGSSLASLTDVATLKYGTVSSYFAIPSDTNFLVCETAAASAPSTTANCRTSSYEFFTYNSVAFSGTIASPTIAQLVTQGANFNTGGIIVSSLQLLTNAGDGQAEVVVPGVFGTKLTSHLGAGDGGVTLSLNPLVWANITGTRLDEVIDGSAPQTISYDLPAVVPSGSAVTLFLGGDASKTPYALLCGNDGTVDSAGHSACAFAPSTANPTAYVRFINATRRSVSAQYPTMDICMSTTGTPWIISLPNPGIAAYIPLPATATFDYYLTGHGQGCDHAFTSSTTNTLEAGTYYTFSLFTNTSGTSVSINETSGAPPPQDDTHVLITTGNAWDDDTAAALTFELDGTTLGSAVIYGVVDTGAYQSFAASSLTTQLRTVDTSTSDHFVYDIPANAPLAFSGGIYSAIAVRDPAAAGNAKTQPFIYWCAQNVITNGQTVCAMLTPTVLK